MSIQNPQDLNRGSFSLTSMAIKPEKKGGATGSAASFVSTMLESARENKPVTPQTRFDQVDEAQLEQTMNNLKKGVIRR